MGGESGGCGDKSSATDMTTSGTGGTAVEKGTKRIRNYTSASARAVDEDEPGRGSPRVRLTPCTREALVQETA